MNDVNCLLPLSGKIFTPVISLHDLKICPAKQKKKKEKEEKKEKKKKEEEVNLWQHNT